MAITAERITVGAAAVALNPVDTGPSGTGLVVQAIGTAGTHDVALGASDVAAGTGFRLPATDGNTFLPLHVRLSAGEQLFAIRAGAADGTVHVLRTGG